MKEIILTQSEAKKLKIELSPNTDYTFVNLNPDVVTFNKAQGVLRAKNVLSENAKIIFTPTKNGFSGKPFVLVTKVRKREKTRIEPSISSVTLKENEFIEISINTEDRNFSFNFDSSKISVEKISPYKIRVKGISLGDSNITIKASASGKAPSKLKIPVSVIESKNKVFYFGQIPTSSNWDWNAYDSDPENFNFEPFINQTLTKEKLQEFDYDLVNSENSFSPRLNEINSFVYFVFEKGEDNIILNSTPNFDELSEYPLNSRKYEFSRDLGQGEKTYSVLVTPIHRQSIPSLYIKNDLKG